VSIEYGGKYCHLIRYMAWQKMWNERKSI